MHMAQRGSCVGKDVQRQFRSALHQARLIALQHGQHHPLAAGQGLGQQGIVQRVVQVGLAEEDVEPNGFGILGGHYIYQLRMQRTPPRPATD